MRMARLEFSFQEVRRMERLRNLVTVLWLHKGIFRVEFGEFSKKLWTNYMEYVTLETCTE